MSRRDACRGLVGRPEERDSSEGLVVDGSKI
jgi:hypothetical protein